MKRFNRLLSFGLVLLLCFGLLACNGTKPNRTEEPTGSSAASLLPTMQATPAATTEGTTATQNPTSVPTQSPTINPTQNPVLEGRAVLYQIPGKFDVSMAYVIRTYDNKIIVMDGGEANKDLYNDTRDDFLSLLKTITGEEKPTVDAWFITHCHRDHIGVFNELMKDDSPLCKVKNVYYNFPSRDWMIQQNVLETYENFMIALKNCDNAVVVQLGDVIPVGNVSMEVMLVPDPTITSNGVNESSVVFRATIGEQTVLFLGDLGTASGNRLYRQHKSKLKSDVVQMAHHGSYGVTDITYRHISPKVCLWPDAEFMWDEERNNAGNFTIIKTYNYLLGLNKNIKHYMASEGELLQLEFPLDI